MKIRKNKLNKNNILNNIKLNKIILNLLNFIIILLCLTSCATSVIKIDNNKNTNIKLALFYLDTGQANKAKILLLQAIQKSPDSPVNLDAMAYFWEKTGRLDYAQEYYQRAIQKNPNNGMVLNNYAVFLCQYYKKTHKEIAEKLLSKAINLPDYIYTAQATHNAVRCNN